MHDGGMRAEMIRLTDDMVGYEVEGRDDRIGRVERVSLDGTWAIVSTGRVLGSRYVLPAVAVKLVDPDSEALLVDLARDEIERSPEYRDREGFGKEYEGSVRAYYGSLRAGRSRRR